MAESLLPPTEAFSLLYRPLRPLWTISKLLASFAVEAGGGEVRSSKVVKASERDAVACIWWSEPGRAREPLAMVIRGSRLRRGWWVRAAREGEGVTGRAAGVRGRHQARSVSVVDGVGVGGERAHGRALDWAVCGEEEDGDGVTVGSCGARVRPAVGGKACGRREDAQLEAALVGGGLEARMTQRPSVSGHLRNERRNERRICRRATVCSTTPVLSTRRCCCQAVRAGGWSHRRGPPTLALLPQRRLGESTPRTLEKAHRTAFASTSPALSARRGPGLQLGQPPCDTELLLPRYMAAKPFRPSSTASLPPSSCLLPSFCLCRVVLARYFSHNTRRVRAGPCIASGSSRT